MGGTKIRFAYKTGFRRLWLIVSLVWLGVAGFLATRFSDVAILDMLMALLLPPAALYLFGMAAVWVIEGFAKAD